MLFVGIDPGLSGGIATIDNQRRVLRCVNMPKSCSELLDELVEIVAISDRFLQPVHVMLEDVWSSPQMGVASAFTFGKGLGQIIMGLTATHLDFSQVAPIKWQNVIQCRTPREVRAELGHKDKNINKRKAEELFPLVKVTHANADALLLAEYCWRVLGGRLFVDSAPEKKRGKEKRQARHTHQGTASTTTATARRRR